MLCLILWSISAGSVSKSGSRAKQEAAQVKHGEEDIELEFSEGESEMKNEREEHLGKLYGKLEKDTASEAQGLLVAAKEDLDDSRSQ